MLKLHIVCSGKYYHDVKRVGHKNFNIFKAKISNNLDYQQFNDSMVIFSEYNSRDELLNKYISIYHVIENFMCKYPLVKLNKDTQGNMFSIRNFKAMYERIDNGEKKSLELFLKAISNDSATESIILESYSLLSDYIDSSEDNKNRVNHSLLCLDIKNKDNNILDYKKIKSMNVKQNFPVLLSQLIYYIRNAIVHNKETEYHLSHENLDSEIVDFIENIMLPILEQIVLNLIIEKNDIVWYEHQNIKLYA